MEATRVECSLCDWSVTVPADLVGDVDVILADHFDRDHPVELRELTAAR